MRRITIESRVPYLGNLDRRESVGERERHHAERRPESIRHDPRNDRKCIGIACNDERGKKRRDDHRDVAAEPGTREQSVERTICLAFAGYSAVREADEVLRRDGHHARQGVVLANRRAKDVPYEHALSQLRFHELHHADVEHYRTIAKRIGVFVAFGQKTKTKSWSFASPGSQ